MLRPQGQATVYGDRLIEHDTIACGHCNRIIFVKPGSASTVYIFYQLIGPPREEPGAFCRVCMRPVCLRCHDVGTCTPLERHLEELEARGRLQRSAR